MRDEKLATVQNRIKSAPDSSGGEEESGDWRCSVFVSHIPIAVTKDEISMIFGRFGKVEKTVIPGKQFRQQHISYAAALVRTIYPCNCRLRLRELNLNIYSIASRRIRRPTPSSTSASPPQWRPPSPPLLLKWLPASPSTLNAGATPRASGPLRAHPQPGLKATGSGAATFHMTTSSGPA